MSLHVHCLVSNKMHRMGSARGRRGGWAHAHARESISVPICKWRLPCGGCGPLSPLGRHLAVPYGSSRYRYCTSPLHSLCDHTALIKDSCDYRNSSVYPNTQLGRRPQDYLYIGSTTDMLSSFCSLLVNCPSNIFFFNFTRNSEHGSVPWYTMVR